MGDDDAVSIRPNTSSFSKPHQDMQSTFPLHRVFLPLLYAAAILSCGSCLKTKQQLFSRAEFLQTERELWQGRHWETVILEDELTSKQMLLMEKFKDLKETKDRLGHELRMKEEMMERVTGDNRELLMDQLAKRQKQAAMTWIQQRQETLYGKINTLQEFVQRMSRQQVLEKYGPGPHRVEFQVQIDSMETKRKIPKTARKSKFMIELAPLDLMPHAIETFLDMISSTLWDNTVFYHHATQDHVVAAAPVNYGTFETKNHHFQALGYEGVVFPEYSENIRHEEYTIGFSGKGPNFYINTMDNQMHHGPGGQGHHDLSQDADPCFGKIVMGKKVIQDMMPKGEDTTGGSHQNRAQEPVSWQDYDLTQIIKVRLL
jgi:cyclophilin family peptidyl-prolyl cis-trans isomerase